MSTDPVLQTHGLTHYFGRRAALDGVSLSVPRGSIFALLGRNGSGKSTLIQILLGLLTPTRGSSTVFGENSQSLSPAAVARIGYTPEGHPLPASLRVRDVHAYQQAFYTTWDEATFAANIEPFSFSPTQRVSQLSRGQRAGLAIALAMAPAPDLLVMDDPSLGLDPVARRTLLEAMLLATRRAGSTIFFTSHLLDDVERVADHIAVLDRSVLRVCCPVEVLRRRVRRYSIETNDDAALLAMPNVLQSRREGGRVLLTLANVDDSSIGEVRLAAAGAAVEEVPLTLEESVLGYLGDSKHSVSLLDRASVRPAPAIAEVA
ncbi:MAG: drrA 4 [Phycisphaerales bacterium]|nr:drrA 4 [Phycisphaerales bacterium]